ncbi:unnamed protein product [Haemonchus placei]|uniref:Pyr_redox_dim domain-containing protein n=1 Tax=Haemonchus placei TaxID=6290 RepID=A0A0N4X6Z2_HAEPC|nr:unnamed protein product [Haemonchus placei]
MVSIIPISLLEKAQEKGYDVDTLPILTESEVGPVYDASGNEMEIVEAVTVEAELEGGRRSKLVLHITPLPQDEVLLGMNALKKLGNRASYQYETGRTESLESEGEACDTKRFSC